jgi:hypothetical protein
LGRSGRPRPKSSDPTTRPKMQYEILIAEKVKKGYAETGGNSAASPKAGLSMPAAAPVQSAAKKGAATGKTPAAPPVAAPAPAVVVDLDVTRRIDLEPGDWAVATWRPRKPLEKPAALPFDQAACAARVAKVSTATYGWVWNWSDAAIPVAMTREEAHFWLTAMTLAERGITPKEMSARLATSRFKAISGEDAIKLLEKRNPR